MKILIILAISVFSLQCYSQVGSDTNKRDFSLEEIGWFCNIPTGFKLVDSLTLVRKLGDKELWNKRFSFKNKANSFTCAISLIVDEKKEDAEKMYQTEKDRSYEILSNQKPTLRFDSASTLVTIKDILFDKFIMIGLENEEAKYNHIQLKGFIKGYRFTIVYIYVNEEAKNKIEEQITNSYFKN